MSNESGEPCLAKSTSPALTFTLSHESGNARACRLDLPHGPVLTPIFMPVGTYGAIKGLDAWELATEAGLSDCHIILANTYHVGSRPGADLLRKVGPEGLHEFMRWNRNLLTDSGGFQMVSLLKLLTVSETGVEFENPTTKEMMLLTPEFSMEIQNAIGADIMMVLDDVVSSTITDRTRLKESTERTIRWLDRCIAGHKRKDVQNLYAIVQGGLDPEFREYSLQECIVRDLPGYAIGGLSGGESKHEFWRIVKMCCDRLPKDKPRYLMGVGYPLDVVCAVSLGVDQVDCVYPTRTARFGTALVFEGQMRLGVNKFKNDFRKIDDQCECSTCARYTRAYLHEVVGKEPAAAKLITVHNVAFMLRLCKEMRAAIQAGVFADFVRKFLCAMYPAEKNVRPPQWAVDCCQIGAGIDLGGIWKEDAIEGSDNPRDL